MKRKLLDDISAIYSIKLSILNKLVKLAELCIGDYLVEAELSDEELLEINIGIGKLSILISNDSLEYQFIPSTKLEQLIYNSIIELKSPLVSTSEKGLEEKLISTYKELF